MGRRTGTKKATWRDYEEAVARVQKALDPGSEVTHNEDIVDRYGISRQFDVVVRGRFGAHPVLCLIECKNHGRRKGMEAVEAFAAKATNALANVMVMVSRKGFTAQALSLAKKLRVRCLSLVPKDPSRADFHLSSVFYAVRRNWGDQLNVEAFGNGVRPPSTDIHSFTREGRPLVSWFVRAMRTTYAAECDAGYHRFLLKFYHPQAFNCAGVPYHLTAVEVVAHRSCRVFTRLVPFFGEGFIDWHTMTGTARNPGTVTSTTAPGSSHRYTLSWDMKGWTECQVSRAELDRAVEAGGGTIFLQQSWNAAEDSQVPDLDGLGVLTKEYLGTASPSSG